MSVYFSPLTNPKKQPKSKMARNILSMVMGVGILLNPFCLSEVMAQTTSTVANENLSFIIDRRKKIKNPKQETAWPMSSQKLDKQKHDSLSVLNEELKAINPSELTYQDLITYKVLQWTISQEMGELTFDTERIQFGSGDGFYNAPISSAFYSSIENGSDAKRWIGKLEELPMYYEDKVTNMRRGVETNFVQAKIITEQTLERLKEIYDVPVSEDPLVTVFDKPAEHLSKDSLLLFRKKAEELVKTKIRPAQKQVLDFLAIEYLPNTRPKVGISSMPMGKKYYEYLVGFHTTSKMTPDEVYALGESEVVRIRKKMETAIDQTGFEGSFEDFLKFATTDPQFWPDDLQDALEKGAEIAKRVDYLLPEYFEKLPRLTYGVRLTPEWYKGSGAYHLGDPKTGKAGWVSMGRTSDKKPLFNLPAWILHEGVPGHHLQIALSQECYHIPEFRRTDGITAFVEGWALYAEKLGEEMGMYTTPYEEFGRLTLEMWRACRLVVDTGIHWKGWSREQAVDYMKSYTALIDEDIKKEVLRYIAHPGQALGYKIGEIEIVKCRERAEDALGSNFDLRKFHTMVTDNGIMPMNVLSELTDKWIAEQKAIIEKP